MKFYAVLDTNVLVSALLKQGCSEQSYCNMHRG